MNALSRPANTTRLGPPRPSAPPSRSSRPEQPVVVSVGAVHGDLVVARHAPVHGDATEEAKAALRALGATVLTLRSFGWTDESYRRIRQPKSHDQSFRSGPRK